MLWSRSGRLYVPWLNHGGPSMWPIVVRADMGVTLVGSKASAIADVVTGNGRSYTQGTGVAQPTWTQGDPKYNGRASLTGGSNIIMSSAAFALAQPFTFCWYGWATGTAVSLQVPMSSDYTMRGAGYDRTARTWMHAGTEAYVAGGPSDDGLCHACVAVFNGSSSKFYWDDASTITCNAGTNGISAGVSIMAFAPSPNYYFNSLRTAMIYAGALDASAARRVIQWMQRS